MKAAIDSWTQQHEQWILKEYTLKAKSNFLLQEATQHFRLGPRHQFFLSLSCSYYISWMFHSYQWECLNWIFTFAGNVFHLYNHVVAFCLHKEGFSLQFLILMKYRESFLTLTIVICYYLSLPWEIFSTEALFSLQSRCQESKKILNSNAVYNFSFIIVIFIIYTYLCIHYNP